MFNLTWLQQKAAGKNILSYAAGAVTVAAAWGLVSAHDASILTDGLNDMYNGFVMFGKGLVAVCGVLVPIYTAWKAAHNASPTEQIKNVAAMANDPTIPVKGVIIDNTPQGVALANSIPGPVVPAGTVQAQTIATGTKG